MKNKKITPILGLWTFAFMLWLGRSDSFAAFPPNLSEKSMTAYSLSEQDAEVFEDEEMTKPMKKIDADGLVLTAVDVSYDQKALYGKYINENEGDEGEGWLPSSLFLYDAEAKHKYYTARDSMTIYTSSSLSKRRATIKKYSGIIVLGNHNGALQVVYETKKGYGIGWIDEENFDTRLRYDGREKQILADGSYHFTPVTSAAGEGKTFTLSYVGKKNYNLFDEEKGQYVIIKQLTSEEEKIEEEVNKPSWMRTGWVHYLKMLFSSAYRDQVNAWRNEQNRLENQKAEDAKAAESPVIFQDEGSSCFYELSYTGKEAEASLFLLKRQEENFLLSLEQTNLYYGCDALGNDFLEKMEEPQESALWHVRAMAPMVDLNNPMVITQYDPAWCGKPYGSEGCVGTAGCGLLATMNAVYALTGQYMDLFELRDYAVEKGYRIEGSGTDEGIFRGAAKTFGSKYGFAWDGEGGDLADLKRKLKAGDTAVSHVIGHYVAIVAYDEKKDRYLLLDSNCLEKRETTPFGDWVSPARLTDGELYGQNYYFFKMDEE
ncbi:MAG: hypothetical protein Q4E53_14255 [Eubacteriales bacterium]|nr:hypothetical protein [Eubacteriales bacterium]